MTSTVPTRVNTASRIVHVEKQKNVQCATVHQAKQISISKLQNKQQKKKHSQAIGGEMRYPVTGKKGF